MKISVLNEFKILQLSFYIRDNLSFQYYKS